MDFSIAFFVSFRLFVIVCNQMRSHKPKALPMGELPR